MNPATCPHRDVEPVTTVHGEHVGYLCPDCDTQLPVHWRTEAVASTAHALIAAGYDPLAAMDAIGFAILADEDQRKGHAAQDCPSRVEVTRMRDPEPQYVHGNCAAGGDDA